MAWKSSTSEELWVVTPIQITPSFQFQQFDRICINKFNNIDGTKQA